MGVQKLQKRIQKQAQELKCDSLVRCVTLLCTVELCESLSGILLWSLISESAQKDQAARPGSPGAQRAAGEVFLELISKGFSGVLGRSCMPWAVWKRARVSHQGSPWKSRLCRIQALLSVCSWQGFSHLGWFAGVISMYRVLYRDPGWIACALSPQR